ncbi:hypothetical protein RND71_026368 [Anisodus tanguticus]|uniref:DUF4283 domain-containing protein n=1 Tax=Anisodus tanguticus TaxID=243964 RepID=A0AAE1VAF5_9SOLA|nr:hypothetical protein RND71_026368 [Anisodus tanguticus]
MPKCFTFDEHDICTMPIWVRLHSLPLELWNDRALSRILSRIGRPIGTDKFTHSKKQTSFARALVEIDLSKDLIDCIKLNVCEGITLDQGITYEKLPEFCKTCRRIAHSTATCEKYLADLNRRVQKKREGGNSVSLGTGEKVVVATEGGTAAENTGGQHAGAQTGVGTCGNLNRENLGGQPAGA